MAQMSSLATAGAGPCKLYIKNLHPNITVRPYTPASVYCLSPSATCLLLYEWIEAFLFCLLMQLQMC